MFNFRSATILTNSVWHPKLALYLLALKSRCAPILTHLLAFRGSLMLGLQAVMDASTALLGRGLQGVLATVVKIEGSTYRRAGGRLLITGGGERIGDARESCFESDLGEKVWCRTQAGPCVVTYDSTTDDQIAWQFGLGCNGIVHVLLERVTSSSPDSLSFARQCLLRDEPGVTATVFRADPGTGIAIGDRLAVDGNGVTEGELTSSELGDLISLDAADCLSRDSSCAHTYTLRSAEVEVFFEVIRPPHRLIVFGAGFDAIPLIRAAKGLGWHVTLVDQRASFAHQPAFSIADEVIVAPPRKALALLRLTENTAVVVMNHNFSEDLIVLDELLPSPVRYIGVLGPRARAEKLLAEVDRHSSLPAPDQFARLHAPIGLDIGADNPEEIAIATIAQIVAAFAGRDGRSLRVRPGVSYRQESRQLAEVLV